MSFSLTYPPVPTQLLLSGVTIIGDLVPYTNEKRCGPLTKIIVLRPDDPEIFWDFWTLTYVDLDLSSVALEGLPWYPEGHCWRQSGEKYLFTWSGLKLFLVWNQIDSEKLWDILSETEYKYKSEKVWNELSKTE